MASKLGTRLKQLRDERALTTADLARAAGIDESTMTAILGGDIERPPNERLRGLADLLDVSFDSLLQLVPADRREAERDAERGEAAAGCMLDLATWSKAGAAGEALPSEILLIPAGEVKTRPHDGRAPWTNANPEAVVAATKALQAPLPIDYDHASEKAAASGNPAPAAGWIDEVFTRDGAVWGNVSWTDRAKAHLSAREYRFFSPTFWFDRTTRTIKRLVGGALTNDPAFFMKAIASAEGDTMDEEQRQVLAAKLGLKATATVTEIAAAVGQLQEKTQAAAGPGTDLAAVAKAAGLGAEATAEDVARKVGELASAAADGGTPDPAQFVPISEHRALASRIEALETAEAESKAAAAVDEAVKAGKVTPAGRDWALAYAAKDPEGFRQFVAAQPAIVKDGALVPGLTPPDAAGSGLSPEEKAVAASMGLSEEAYLKSKKQLEEKAQ